jgi:tetratricopeptide (TPR) repeat protein
MILFGPGKTSIYESQSLAPERREKLNKARMIIAESVNFDQGVMSGDLHNDLGIIYYELGLYAEAESELRFAIASDKHWSEPHNNLGNVFDSTDEWAAAIAEYQAAILLESNNFDAYVGLCTVLRRRHRPREALIYAQRAINLEPSNAGAYHSLGAVLDELGDHIAAEHAFRKAVEIRPSEAMAHRSLAIVLLEEKRSIKEALIEIRKATTLRPDNAKNWSLLARTLAATLLSDEAYAAARRAVEIDATDETALRILRAVESSAFAQSAASEYGKRKDILLYWALTAGIPQDSVGHKR